MIKFLKRICSPYPFFAPSRRGMFRAWIVCAAAMIAFPAFATPVQPPAAAAPKYLFELSYDDAEAAIGNALMEKGAGEKVAASINGDKSQPLFSYNRPISVEIRGLQFDKRAARWSASLMVTTEEGDVVTAMPLAGRFNEMIEVPVLKKQVRSSEIITAADVEMRAFPIGNVRADTIGDAAGLVGKSPARAISAFRPIRELEIASPALVKKNGIVQMRYLSPGMEITATGQAIGEGRKGEMIAVRNMASKKIVRAIVENATTVSVMNDGAQTSQLTGASGYETN